MGEAQLTAEPSASWEEHATGTVEAVKAALDPLIRKASDDLYGDLLYAVQDYLLENVLHNVRQQIESADRQARHDRRRLQEVERENTRLRVALHGIAEEQGWFGEQRFAGDDDTDFLLRVIGAIRRRAREGLAKVEA